MEVMIGKLFYGSYCREAMLGKLNRRNLCDVVVRDGEEKIYAITKNPFNRASLAVSPKMEATQMEIFNFM
jgi:hypothetical protein